MKKLDILTILTQRAVGQENAIDSVTLAGLMGEQVNVASSYLHWLWQQDSLARFVSRERRDSLGRPKASYRYYVRKSANIDALLRPERVTVKRAEFDASALEACW